MMLEPMSALSLKVLAPTLFIVAIMGVFRGYFQGLGTMMPTAVSQIVEQVLVVIASLIGAYVSFQYGGKVGELLQGDAYPYAYGAAGASLGPGLGAALGLGFLLFVFCAFRSKFNRQIKKDITKKEESYGTIFKILILTIVPVILSTAIYNISNVLDQRLFNQVMIGKGFEEIKASIWGVYVGKYRVLVNIPIALASAMCASSVPAITALMSRGDKKQVREKISSVIRVTMIISIPCAIGMSVLARPIIDLLFNGEIDLAVNMMYVGTASIVFYSMSTLSNGILQGINRMKIPVTNAAISLVVHLIALFVMLQYFDMGIYAVVYANILFSLQMCIMNSLAIRKHMKYKQEFQQTFIIPLLSAGIMGVIVFLVNKLLEMLIGKSTVGQLIQVAVGGILGVFIYFILLIVLRGVTEKDLASIPFGNKIIKVAKALHILP